MKKYDMSGCEVDGEGDRMYDSGGGRKLCREMGSEDGEWESVDREGENGCMGELEDG